MRSQSYGRLHAPIQKNKLIMAAIYKILEDDIMKILSEVSVEEEGECLGREKNTKRVWNPT